MKKPTDYPVRHLQDPCAVVFRNHKAGYCMPMHWHSYYELEIVIEGEYEHIYNENSQTAHPGQVWIMSPLDRHSLRTIQKSSIINISFSTNVLAKEIAQALDRSPSALLTKLSSEETEIIYHLCRQLQHETENPDFHFRSLMMSSLLNSILIKVLRHHADSSSTSLRIPHRMQSVAQILHTEYSRDLSLSEIAQSQNISVGHMGVLFRQTFGTSFNEYLNRIRLRHACDMLYSSQMTIEEIARECGYRSTEYFYYIFRKYLGITPGEHRRRGTQ